MKNQFWKLASTICSDVVAFICDFGSNEIPPDMIDPHIPKVPYVIIEWLDWLKSARSTPKYDWMN